MLNFEQMDHLLPDRNKQFLSMGFVMQLEHITPAQLRVLMEETNIKFSEVRDGIGYLKHDDAIAVMKKCGDVRREISDKLQATPNN